MWIRKNVTFTGSRGRDFGAEEIFDGLRSSGDVSVLDGGGGWN